MTRDSAIITELEAQRTIFGSRAAVHAARIAELEIGLAAAHAEIEAQRLRADAAEERLAAYPPPGESEDPLGR